MSSKIKIRPLHDRVVIKQAAAETQTKGGLVIPTKAQERPTEGRVIAVGPGYLLPDGERHPLPVKAGDTVMYAKYAGIDISVDGAAYVIVGIEDVLAVVEA